MISYFVVTDMFLEVFYEVLKVPYLVFIIKVLVGLSVPALGGTLLIHFRF